MYAPTPFRDFADWRLHTYETRPRESVRFFRSSLNHSMVWMLVMRGHFDDRPPTVGECQEIGRCSRLTARKLIADAVVLGYFEIRTDAEDHRKRSVVPTERTISEYVEMVRGYMEICDRMRPHMEPVGDCAALPGPGSGPGSGPAPAREAEPERPARPGRDLVAPFWV